MSVVSRVAALLVAIAMVIGALVWRAGQDGQGGEGGGPGLLDGGTLAASCVEELEQLCLVAGEGSDLDWSFGPAATLSAALEGPEPLAVVLPTAWADVADDARGRAGREPLVRSEVLASSPLLVVAFADRAQVLADACGIPVAQLGWSCIGEHAGARWQDIGGAVTWGEVRIGHAPPTTGTGLLATASVAAAQAGTPFSLADLREPSFTSWFRRVEGAVPDFTPGFGSHLTTLVVQGRSAPNPVAATEAEVITTNPDRLEGTVVSAAEPLFAVELVVAGTDDGLVEDLTAALSRAALADAGWRTADGPPPGAPLAELPPLAERPSGGALTALRTTWEQLAG